MKKESLEQEVGVVYGKIYSYTDVGGLFHRVEHVGRHLSLDLCNLNLQFINALMR